MTTIIYKDGEMYGDSRAFSGDASYTGAKTKVFKIESGKFAGALVGASTTQVGLTERLVKWIEMDDMDEEKYPSPKNEEFVMLFVDTSGQVFLFDNSKLMSGPLEADYFAVGSGQKYALGALAANRTAEEALEIAIQLDIWSDYPIKKVALAL